MRVLIVSATALEAKGIIKGDVNLSNLRTGTVLHLNNKADLLISGVGQAMAAYHLGTQLLQQPYELAVNIGICGTFNRDIPLGTVVRVVSDSFFDLGAEDDNQWLSVFQMGLINNDEFPFRNGLLIPAETGYFTKHRKVKGITVNRATGSEMTVKNIMQYCDADVESMEGAAFTYSCMQHEIPSVQLKAVSNYIEKRNRQAWDIELALSNLTVALQELLND
jgi:futalosine hydrolase